MQDTWEEKATPTARFWHRRLSKRMNTVMFRAVATRLIERETFFPEIQDFVREARKLRRAKRNKIEMERSRERLKREAARERRQFIEEVGESLARQEGVKVAQALRQGRLDLVRKAGGEIARRRQLPADTEESYRKADDVSSPEEAS